PIVYYGGKYYTSIGFADKGYACLGMLGYQSPDSKGKAIWTVIIQCSILHDENSTHAGVGGWLQTLCGLHMFLGFKNSPCISPSDFSELAYRITGTGGYPKESIKNAFFHTFVKDDSVHKNNIARIIAEDSNVADHDTIDSWNSMIYVDNVKVIYACWIPG
ncbi:MAG: hypothetical protein H5T50_07720, partial [Nitrososphaeria archaeon]|nr:hypothetical protein [Nitrososphaeria archaeon]